MIGTALVVVDGSGNLTFSPFGLVSQLIHTVVVTIGWTGSLVVVAFGIFMMYRLWIRDWAPMPEYMSGVTKVPKGGWKMAMPKTVKSGREVADGWRERRDSARAAQSERDVEYIMTGGNEHGSSGTEDWE